MTYVLVLTRALSQHGTKERALAAMQERRLQPAEKLFVIKEKTVKKRRPKR